jgi:hypothetical protein
MTFTVLIMSVRVLKCVAEFCNEARVLAARFEVPAAVLAKIQVF